jgi:hypothetical protein
MTRTAQLFCFYILYSGVIFAQDEVKSIRISEFHFQNGLDWHSFQPLSLEDCNELAPNSMMNQLDLSEFQSNAYYMYSGSFSISSMSYQSIQLGLSLKAKPSSIWRIGINHGSTALLSKGLSRSEIVRYDTLTSSQTGEEYYIDSTYSESYFVNYGSKQLRFETALIFGTNKEKRWSIYAGLGLSFGISYNSETMISYSSNSGVSGVNSTYDTAGDYTSKSENFRNKMNSSSSIFIPMGVDFRIGKNRDFWNRIHLYYEIKPSVTFTSIPELRLFTSVNMISSFGLKVTI